MTIPIEFAFCRGIRTIGAGTGEGHFHLSISSSPYTGEDHFHLSTSTSPYTGLFALSLSGGVIFNLTDLRVNDPSVNSVHNFDDLDTDDPVPATVGVICALVIVGIIAVFLYKKRNKVKATQHIAQAEAGPDTSANLDRNLGTFSGQINPQATSAVQSILPQPLSTILPMASITPTPEPQQQQTAQNQMKELGFSSHPRPTVACVATGEPWQPTPFVPPGSSQRVRAPEFDESTSVTGETSIIASSSPPIPRNSRPSPEVDAECIQSAVHSPHA
jgi:hypothetical protein